MIWLILAAPAAPAACELNCLLERNASGDRVPVLFARFFVLMRLGV